MRTQRKRKGTDSLVGKKVRPNPPISWKWKLLYLTSSFFINYGFQGGRKMLACNWYQQPRWISWWAKSMKESTNTMKIGPYSLKKDQPQVTLKHLPLSNLFSWACFELWLHDFKLHDFKLHFLIPRRPPSQQPLPLHFPIMYFYFRMMKRATYWIMSCLPQIAAHLFLEP